MVALPAAADDKRKFTICTYMYTHVRFKDFSMVYINDPVWVENSTHTMEQLLANEKYKVAGFDLMPGKIRRLASPSCVGHYVLVYH
ncbi:hypothetical protein D1007_35378 [Hordeum vulgare]|nr:hypothetical protein D1007_35378 [Hordeum vulgare]